MAQFLMAKTLKIMAETLKILEIGGASGWHGRMPARTL
jgi:hypothetical protein